MYRTLWNFTKKHVKRTHAAAAFLTVLAVGWTLIGFLSGAAGCILTGNTAIAKALTLILCTGGYLGLIFGFIGGVLYLYNTPSEESPQM